MNSSKRKIVIILLLATLAIVVSGIIIVLPRPPNQKVYSEDESRQIARNFVHESETYLYDGYNLTYYQTLYPDIEGCESCYTFIFDFKSRHAGYGNRTSQNIGQIITQHTAYVTTEQGEVTSASLDGKWNIMKQEGIKS